MTDFIAHADQESDANRNMTVMVFLCATHAKHATKKK